MQRGWWPRGRTQCAWHEPWAGYGACYVCRGDLNGSNIMDDDDTHCFGQDQGYVLAARRQAFEPGGSFS